MNYRLNIIVLTLLSLFISNNVDAKSNPADTLSMTYQRFMAQKGIEKHDAYFNIYKQDKKFWMEIPKEALGKDVLITCQAISGSNNFFSPASDVVTFSLHDFQTIYMSRHRTIDYQNDTLSCSMMGAIRNSSMMPVDRAIKIVSLGEKGNSYIIDITQDVTSPTGFFEVTKNTSLNHPDPNRSGFLGVRGIEKGFSMEVFRSQTDAVPYKRMDNMVDISSTVVLQFVMQCVPSHKHDMRIASPAFGFQKTTRQEYDTKHYVSRTRDYISTWDFTTGPITIYVNPNVPAPFMKSVKKAVANWTSVFNAAGIKKPFEFSTEQEANNLAYKCITINWGYAANGLNSQKIVSPLTGEILSARINIQDRKLEDYYEQYFVQCRHIDSRVKKDMKNLDMRIDVLTSMLTAELGKVFGMESNHRGASVTTPFKLNHAAPSGASVSSLIPQISDYDRKAIMYAYGKKDVLPALCDFYSAEDKLDPYAQKISLSSDILAESRQGLENVKRSFATYLNDAYALPSDQINVNGVSHMAMQHMVTHELCLNRVASLIGGRSKYPVIKGVSEKPVVYVPRATQLAALKFLEENILSGAPEWTDNEEISKLCNSNMNSLCIGAANGVVKTLMSADVLKTLSEQERTMGASNSLTVKELTDYINRLVFCDFNAVKAPTDYQRKMQITAVLNIAEYVQSHNLVTGMQNEGNSLLQVYLVDIAKKIADLAENHADEETREHFSLLKMRMDRIYFKKKI